MIERDYELALNHVATIQELADEIGMNWGSLRTAEILVQERVALRDIADKLADIMGDICEKSLQKS